MCAIISQIPIVIVVFLLLLLRLFVTAIVSVVVGATIFGSWIGCRVLAPLGMGERNVDLL